MIDNNLSNKRPAYAVAGGTSNFTHDMCCPSGTTSNICDCDDREAGGCGGGSDDVAIECCEVVFCCIFVFFL